MENIKNIIAPFIDKDPAQINNETVIDRSVIKGSVLIHRMYAALSTEGVVVPNYTSVRTYGDLINVLNGNEVADTNSVSIKGSEINIGIENSENSIGLDIEQLVYMPETADFRNDQFYLENFTAKEISYCILKPHPRQSFLGLFCAKEALCKIDLALAHTKFNKIEISHTPAGKPFFGKYLISISHTADIAAAIAIEINNKKDVIATTTVADEKPHTQQVIAKSSNTAVVIATLSIIISIITLIMYFLK